MEKQQIIQVCQQYDTYLESKGFMLCERNNDAEDIFTEAGHIRWMLSEIPNKIERNEMEKVHRWLGFIQGYLWVNNFYQISELRNHNR